MKTTLSCLLLFVALSTYGAIFPDTSTDQQVIINSNNTSSGTSNLRWIFPSDQLAISGAGSSSSIHIHGGTPYWRLYAGGNPATTYSRLEALWDSGNGVYALRENVSGSNAIPLTVGINLGSTLTFNTDGTATFSGGVGMSGRTNRLSISAGGQLLLDGNPIASSGVALTDLNSNQFSTNGGTVSIKSGAIHTNIVDTGTTKSDGLDATNSFRYRSGAATGFAMRAADATGLGEWSTNFSELNVTNLSIVNNITVKNGGNLTVAGGSLSGDAFVVVGGSSIGLTNGLNLLAAYTAAKTKTPHGAALAAGNRYTIYLLPGKFDLGSSTLTLDTLYIDVVGLGDNASGAMVYSVNHKKGDVFMTSSGTVININSSADSGSHDIQLANMNVETSTASSSSYCIDTTQTGYGSKWQCINVLFTHSGSANPARMMSSDKNFNGTWIDVRAWGQRNFGDALFGNVAINGTFIRCKGANKCFGNVANAGSTVPTLSGWFIDCEGDANSFGETSTAAGAVLSGNFIRCIGGMNTGGGGAGSSMGGSGGTMSGYFQDIMVYTGAGNAMGGGTMSGVMDDIHGSTGTITPSWTSVTGKVNGGDFTGWNGPYAMNTSDSTQVSNTASESNFSVTRSIATADWKVGRAFRWEAWGKYSSTNVTPGTITFKTKFGSTAEHTSDAMNLPIGGSNLGWKANGVFVCRTIGGSGTIQGFSHWEMEQGTLGVLNESMKTDTTTTTIANNGALTFQISVTFSAASASNAATLQGLLLHPLNAN